MPREGLPVQRTAFSQRRASSVLPVRVWLTRHCSCAFLGGGGHRSVPERPPAEMDAHMDVPAEVVYDAPRWGTQAALGAGRMPIPVGDSTASTVSKSSHS